ncbi:hypothetical protein ACPPVO_35695 [Dactylosporangium sp. McL0621]|uniref:hypothetical protein n=1 Tax=Dactylosporangium sp. McL0621 TaxID=3415678 RepID=UPI003CEA0304
MADPDSLAGHPAVQALAVGPPAGPPGCPDLGGIVESAFDQMLEALDQAEAEAIEFPETPLEVSGVPAPPDFWSPEGEVVGYVAHQLADLLIADGSVEEAVGLLEQHATGGDWLAGRQLARLLEEQGRDYELRQRAESGGLLRRIDHLASVACRPRALAGSASARRAARRAGPS